MDPYSAKFEETLDMRRFEAYRKLLGRIEFDKKGGRLILTKIKPGSSAAKIPAWRTRIRRT